MSKLLLLEESYLNSFIASRNENQKKILSLVSENDIKDKNGKVVSLSDSIKNDFSADKISKKNGKIFEINISGLLTDTVDIYSWFFDEAQTLYSSIQEAVTTAKNDDEIEEIVFNVNSPGGYVNGVDITSSIIAKCGKKKTAVVYDMAASAAYWLVSQCDVIISKSATAEFGSIGVAVELYDYDGYYEGYGIKHYTLTSKNAENKRPDISKQSGRDKIITRLTETENVFLARVAEGRKTTVENIKKNYGRGGVLIADKAIKAGMIDIIENQATGLKNNPDSTGKNKKEGSLMDLDQLLNENPEARKVYEKRIDEAKESGKAEIQKRIDASKNYIGNDNYPKIVNETAIKVLSGEQNEAALIGAVAACDQVKAQAESDTAQAESASIQDTPPAETQVKKSSADSTEDVVALAEMDKGV